ncbi:hypothetical protein [Roseivirga spongicola]|jgi:hypothetical protein|uniref:hypothetical protein n=1 Tax=Roseivirga spongicola TaxID=333140 RepID=UPI000D7A4E33|nr:hypothetical protein [Roseivirga spongicola]PWL29995.1 MAG: hypothetical protein DCO95_09170 [Roseivirga sp. XM-24bin3]WPZ11311.1 hypothetical protein T7867_04240 [Roseivirga spongicola]
MIRKVTIFSLTMVALLLVEQNVFAQEEGGVDDKTSDEIITQKDSALIFESGEMEQIVQPTATPFNIPVKEPKRNATPMLENTINRPIQEGEIKPKENKQDFSFNIIYYLLYKFKQVDN